MRGEKISHTAFKVFKLWAPYLGILILFLGWRFIYFPTIMTGTDPNSPEVLLNLAQSPLATLLTFAQAVLQDVVYLVVFAWAGNTVQASSINLSLFSTLYSWAIGLGLAVLLAWALIKFGRDRPDLPLWGRASRTLSPGRRPCWGCWACWAEVCRCGRSAAKIIVGKWSDRYALAPMVGAVILVACMLEAVGRGRQSAAQVAFPGAAAGFFHGGADPGD